MSLELCEYKHTCATRERHQDDCPDLNDQDISSCFVRREYITAGLGAVERYDARIKQVQSRLRRIGGAI